jgi:hypothetical protein
MKYRAIYKGGDVVAKFENDVLVWAADEYLHPESKQTHHVMPDIQPYQSQIDGSYITSRSQHRSHLKQHGCFEIGNETKYITKSAPLTPPPGLKQKLIEVANAKL